MTSKNSRFDLDWWVVQKRQIYIIVSLVVFALLAGGAGLYVWKYGNPFSSPKTTTDAPAGARFTSFEGDVRVIRASTRETLGASLQTQLYPGDTVQTQADGRARIILADGSTLVVRPNSTVIIRDNTRSETGEKTNVRVKVDTGQINVRTEQQAEGTNNVVETNQTQSKLASDTASSFNVNPDQTAEIRVQTGQIETSTSNGEKTIIRNGEYVAVNPAGAIGRRERLLDVPAPSEPRNLEKVPAGAEGSANVTLRWQRPPSGTAAYFRVEVATSPFFVAAGKVIERDQLASNEFNASDLRPGDYFWRVRASARSGQVSDWSEPQKFTITPQGTGGRLSFSEVTAEYVGGQIYVIHGRTQPGTTVSSVGREILSDSNGLFRLQIVAPEGAREVTIAAQDQQGNHSEQKVQLSAGVTHQRK
ncbi:MAG TPA: FecR domain-containing protein [Pyrinomonadaceae bacterium]|nr:FecR domain-containing protein [Pyrinomonadaceae bacterium]